MCIRFKLLKNIFCGPQIVGTHYISRYCIIVTIFLFPIFISCSLNRYRSSLIENKFIYTTGSVALLYVLLLYDRHNFSFFNFHILFWVLSVLIDVNPVKAATIMSQRANNNNNNNHFVTICYYLWTQKRNTQIKLLQAEKYPKQLFRPEHHLSQKN